MGGLWEASLEHKGCGLRSHLSLVGTQTGQGQQTISRMGRATATLS